MLTRRDGMRVGVPAASGASVAHPKRLAYRPRRPSRRRRWHDLRLGLIAAWHAAELDRELADGALPDASALLSARGRQITGRRSRAQVADGLSRAVRDAESARSGFSAAVAPDRGEIAGGRTVLAALDGRLRDPEPVTAHGMALLRCLLSDGGGPLYQPTEPGALGSRLRAAAALLEPGDAG